MDMDSEISAAPNIYASAGGGGAALLPPILPPLPVPRSGKGRQASAPPPTRQQRGMKRRVDASWSDSQLMRQLRRLGVSDEAAERERWERQERRRARGDHVTCVLEPSQQQELLLRWNASAECVAIAAGYVLLFEDGSVTADALPPKLDALLRSGASAPTFLSLGAEGHFYVEFEDGRRAWNAPASFAQAVEGRDFRDVSAAAFAPDGGWFLLWDDGQYEWHDLPPALGRVLEADGARVRNVSVAADGAYFVSFYDSSWLMNGPYPHDLERFINDLEGRGGSVKSVVFGQGAAGATTWCARWSR